MRKEIKEIVWHGKDEKPDAAFADVLVRILKTNYDEQEQYHRVYYETWQWFNAPHVTPGFYRDGQLLNDSTYRPMLVRVVDFEWCYLAKAEDKDEYAISLF